MPGGTSKRLWKETPDEALHGCKRDFKGGNRGGIRKDYVWSISVLELEVIHTPGDIQDCVLSG
jgi:hypothetical protein